MRVIAGALGGRPLAAPKGHATRPTSDRVREALFNVLGDVRGAIVLDLYAGTGALGIEALSRGARHAVFVENARPALVTLRRNLDDLGLAATSAVIGKPVHRTVASLSVAHPLDLVLVDPPYADLADAVQALETLVARGTCAPEARIVLEHASRDLAPNVKGLVIEATRKYGDTSLSFYSAGSLATMEDVSRTDADE